MLKYGDQGGVTEQDDIESMLEGEGGEPTLLADVVSEFLESEDFGEAFAAVLEAVKSQDGAVDEEIEDEQVTLGISGELVAEALDLDDLAGDFAYFVEEELAADMTLTGKAMFKAVLEAHGLELTEFKKGDFKKLPAATRNRFLGAMIAKGAIKKVQRGKGYKKGDYQKNGGYPSGKGKGGRNESVEQVDELISQKDAHNPGFGNLARWTRFKKSNKAAIRKSALKDKKSVTIRGAKVGGAARRVASIDAPKLAKLAKKGLAKKGLGKKHESTATGAASGSTVNETEGHRQFGHGVESGARTLEEATANQRGAFARLATGGGVPTVRPAVAAKK